MARTRTIGKRSSNPRRVAYRMANGRKFYEKYPRDFPYGALPYVQNYYWTSGYCVDD
jgi:hypothetical protein